MRSITCAGIPICCCWIFAATLSAAQPQPDAAPPGGQAKTLRTRTVEEALKRDAETGTGYGGHFSCNDFTGIDRALCVAASDVEPEEVRRLVAAGADLEAISSGRFTKGMTMLLVGVLNKWDVKAIELLIEAGANVHAKDAYGNTAVIHAAESRPNVQREMIELLLEAGADVNSRGERGMTPLMHVAMHDDAPAVGMLIRAGAKLHAKDRFGWTALMHAVRTKQGFPEVIATLIQAGADVNATHSQGGSALSIASYNGHTKAVELLLRSGANVNVRDRAGWTPLICASFNGHTQVAKMLIASGAALSATDSIGRTPLALASHFGHDETAALLRKAGAK
ncbi:MAG TPA: ankyrin repeat domain-containing protein [Thermoguttaceae bacterium]|nr:ankyrin repeat domain-containing protein [Thermoguttaceae bacterium]